MEIRVVVKGVRFAGVGTAWWHPFGRQAPYQRGVVFCSQKMLFFVFFAQQELPGGILVPPGTTSSLLGTRRHQFSSLHSFRKNAFLDLLTVRFR